MKINDGNRSTVSQLDPGEAAQWYRDLRRTDQGLRHRFICTISSTSLMVLAGIAGAVLLARGPSSTLKFTGKVMCIAGFASAPVVFSSGLSAVGFQAEKRDRLNAALAA